MLINFYKRNEFVIEAVKEAAVYRHAWRLKIDWIGRRDDAILTMSSEFS